MDDFQNPVFSTPVEGTMETQSQSSTQNSSKSTTLDEPVRDTIMRDLKAVCRKFTHILYPRKNSELLKDWDLWGPLLLCVMLALLLQSVKRDEVSGGMGPQFTEVFVVIWVGAAVVSVNSSLLGGNISLFQSICVLGYCIFPLFLAMIICWLVVHIIGGQATASVIIRIITALVGYIWSVYASIVFLGESQPNGRKALAVYPICLFYFILAWMVATYS